MRRCLDRRRVRPADIAAAPVKWLMEVMRRNSTVAGLSPWVLSTKDRMDVRTFVHKLSPPERWMERPDPNMREILIMALRVRTRA